MGGGMLYERWEATWNHWGSPRKASFLSIGEKLQGFYQRAGEISKISSTVANLMSGEELGAVIEGFRNVIERMKRLEGESRRNTETLRDVLENLTHLNHQVEGFRNDHSAPEGLMRIHKD